ncbi:hypothetical protein NLI96_g13084 [Meripilus lineatus]|uniref:Uncharacterized protein n=1 Tax=Meripilus lineatus TaxID=2056292 RepID=A0AAD5UR51_9APHY|nr:hypothetical protein NLI96_g13084 [Physisporinus lineatus]
MNRFSVRRAVPVFKFQRTVAGFPVTDDRPFPFLRPGASLSDLSFLDLFWDEWPGSSNGPEFSKSRDLRYDDSGDPGPHRAGGATAQSK